MTSGNEAALTRPAGSAGDHPQGERLIAGVERAVSVLMALADGPGPLGTNELARRTGINASTVSRLLATLARDELVQRVPATGRYRLGLRLIRLGNAALAGVEMREIARPHLLALMETTGETATLSVPTGGTAVTVDFVQSPSTVRSVAEIGRPSVPHATATGKVYLAWTDVPTSGAALPALTPHTITDPERLAEEVARVREQGWAQARSEREVELHAVAVPVVDGRGRLAAILAVQGPAGRFGEQAMAAAVARLRDRAAALSASLMWS
ncbi:IclR family transcriptional regulator [Pseudonocardia adelaidensis]